MNPAILTETHWQKLGKVYGAQGEKPWMMSHAYVPTSILLSADRIRVFVAFLDENKIGRVGYVDVDAADPTRVLSVSQKPVLDVGGTGSFDANGVTPTCIVRHQDGRLFLYYAGWQTGVGVRYTLFTGLAVSEDNGESFRRISPYPVLEPCEGERFFRTAANVVYDEGRWEMWYIGGDEWTELNGKAMPVYDMRYVESTDGIHWPAPGFRCMVLGPDEHGLGRPCVVKERGIYRNWYSIRKRETGYRIGYGESRDGQSWVRMDELAGITVSPTGWDSQTLSFAWIQDTPQARYLFYNGNDFGLDGFGVAKAIDPGSF